MPSEPTLVRLRAEFDSPPEAIDTVVALLESGASPEFIGCYRRDETGDMDEQRVLEIAERLHFLDDLETRKQAIRQQAEQQQRLNESLLQTLAKCFDQDLLDDIYQTFRPSRRTLGMRAIEKGLGKIAQKILADEMRDEDLPALADSLISAEKDLPTREAVLEGILHIISEQVASDPDMRSKTRNALSDGILTSEGVATKKKGGHRFKEYFEYSQPVRRVQGNHLLNIWRGEREGVLKVRLSLEEGKSVELVKKHLNLNCGENQILEQYMGLVCQHTVEQMLLPACEADVRHQIKERVDRMTARNLARNLRSQLMTPPLGHKKVLGVRASRHTVWLALLGEDGSLLKHLTLDMNGDEKQAESLKAIAELIDSEQPVGIALPHGRHQEVTSQVLLDERAKPSSTQPMIVPVDEAASAIHATSASARKQWPGIEVGLRTAISLASRLQDSLLELLSLDPKALGLGHALEEVHQGLLTRLLDQTISSCVAKVGLDLNRASAAHLSRAPGMTKEIASRIVNHRQKSPFKSRAELLEKGVLNEREFEHVAGFLRVEGGEQPLDMTSIHPESYALVDKIATAEGCTVNDLLGKRVRTHATALADEQWGILRVKDAIFALSHFGEDARGELTAVKNDNVRTVADLRPDVELRGRVTNLTEFGAFVDLGVQQDGLVHVSQIPASRIRDPRRMLAVGEVITVYVLNADADKKRISLSMHKPRHLVEGRQPTIGERLHSGGRRGRQDRGPTPREPLTRAARAPDSRRGRPGGRPGGGGRPGAGRPGPGRGGPRTGQRHGGPRQPTGAGDRRGGGSRDYDGRRGPRGGEPRVITVESERPIEEVRGHRGELTSLSSLAKLVQETGPAPSSAPIPPGDSASAPAASPSPQTERAATPASAEATTEAAAASQAAAAPTAAEPAATEPTAATPAAANPPAEPSTASASSPPAASGSVEQEQPQPQEQKPLPDTPSASDQKETTEGLAGDLGKD